MIICLCNRLSESQIRHAAETHRCEPSEIYRALGCAPKCGKCVPLVCEIVRRTESCESAAEELA
ncbi:MAG: (2Fe-2S)-binding protein [Candidatus Binataceae bacterium]